MSAYEEAESTLKAKLGNLGGGHDFDHTLRVIQNARKLSEEIPEADKEVVRFAALLHDIARPEEQQSKGACNHAVLGAIQAAELLKKLRLPAPFVTKVAEAIRTHRYRDNNPPVSIEAKILYDADKLDSLGAIGIGRAFLFAGMVGARVHNDAETALNNPAYGSEDTAYREYLVKLQYLPKKMQTVPGRKLAQERAAFMKAFFDRLNAECRFAFPSSLSSNA